MFWHKVDYKGDTYEKTYVSDYSQSETDGCVINLAKEYDNEKNEEFKKYTFEINDTNKSKLSKDNTK